MALTVELFAAVEEALGLEPTTLKIGIMDEEKRTSLNLETPASRGPQDRVIFVNTGFLDRTGDEIHTDFEAGPVVRKDDMKSTPWLLGYEDRNVDVALRAGFAGQAQVGKGMWAKPAAMAEMLATKGAQPAGRRQLRLGALADRRHAARPALPATPTCWPGSGSWPAATTDRRLLLEVPVLAGELSDEEKRHELETNAQSILGYVVRWVGLGIGCSTVPDLDGRRADGGPGHAAHLQPADRQLAAPRAGRRGPGARDLRPDGRARRRAERRRAGVPADGARTSRAASPSRPRWTSCSPAGAEPNGYTERALTTWRQRAKSG